VAIDLLRGSRVRCIVDLENEDYAALPDPAPGPDAIVQARSEVRAVERAMRCLPPRHQLVLLALRIEGKTREEVARTQGISTRRVDTILRQSLDHCAVRPASRLPVYP
jgi:RNA polymerase sigma-70 factor (ECF subfamily)